MKSHMYRYYGNRNRPQPLRESKSATAWYFRASPEQRAQYNRRQDNGSKLP